MADEPRFDPSGIGVWQDEDTFEVTADRIAEYARATNDPIEAHLTGSLAPPVFAIVPVFNSMIPAALSVAPAELVPYLVHGEQDFLFHQPIRPDTTLISRARATGYEGKTSGTRGTVHIECRDKSNGELVNEQWVTFFFRKFDAGEKIGSLGPDHHLDEKVTEAEPVAEVTAHVDTDQTFRYSPASGDPMPIHLDDEIARMSGLPGIIAHGLCTMAFTSWAVLDSVADRDTARLRRLAVRFSKPVLPGQDITTRIWRTGDQTYGYRTAVGDTLVITDGLAELRETA